ncbi:CHC2 zinc finger domain-containing protein [Inquilinus limosus]|uniref:CHC2 zinc finger domain-containing protein n=1 Tax=Inquilinus limosus TaxID=171674 RepID=UPI0006894058|nr:CHC2 zinc finger domain-containing protein [Inquilinus limosus]
MTSLRIDANAVRDAIPLPDLIGRYVTLVPDGREFKACCPFHKEKTPSFHVVPEKGFYHCFGCGAHGDGIDFVMEQHGVGFREACQIIAGDNVVPATTRPKRDTPSRPDPYDAYKPIIPVPADAPAIVAGSRTPKVINIKREDDPDRREKSYRPSLVHPYRTADGSLIGYVIRVDIDTEHKITPAIMFCETPGGERRWCLRKFPTPALLYGLDRLTSDRTRVVCEGEKAADAAYRMLPNNPCLAWPSGSKAYPRADFTPLAGSKVLLWPDADTNGNGEDAMRAVAEILFGLGCEVGMVDVSGLAEIKNGFDAADLPEGTNVEEWLKPRIVEYGRTDPGEHPTPANDLGPSAPAESKRQRRSRARNQPANSNSPDGGGRSGRPTIQLANDWVHENANQTEDLLIKAGLPIFTRAGHLVRPVTERVPAADNDTVLVGKFRAMTSPELIDAMAEAIRFERYDGRSEDWVPAKPPQDVASILMTREGRWRFPAVVGIVTTPTLRRDGSVLSEPGYDPITRVFYAPDSRLRMPALPERPSQEDAVAALDLLKDLLIEFPFVSPVDRAVALSGILTAVCRPAMPVAPMHAIKASTAGSGKTYLVDVASITATGQRCPVITMGKVEEETEKRLGALLMAGVPIISLDNCNGEMGGDMLCQMVERPMVRARILGRSEAPEIEVRSTCFATGNNLQLRGDMTRRAVVCNLDAGVERPELRTFTFKPAEVVSADRGKYVAAALTVVRAYLVAGRPGKLPAIGSYEVWSDMIRSALVWLGEADPVASMEKARDEDPQLMEIKEVFGQWRDCLQLGARYTPRAIIHEATNVFNESGTLARPDFSEAIMKIAANGRQVSSKSLGRWLMRHQGRVVNGLKIISFPDEKHGNKYSLVSVEDAVSS